MLKSAFKTAYVLLAAFALAFVCAYFLYNSHSFKENEAENQRIDVIALRGAYRNSSLIVDAECISSHPSPMGTVFSDYSVIDTVAGKPLEKGRIITVLGSDEAGSRRILYLNSKIEDVHSENEAYYTLVEGGKFYFDGINIELSDEKSIPIELVKNDIRSLSEETMIPSKYYYYSSIESVVSNSTSVFIGRVDGIKRVENAELFTNDRGEVIKKTGGYTDISVTVLNGLVWEKHYGDTALIRLIDESEKFMVRSDTNEPFISNAKIFAPLEGGVYVFFVKKSPDEKAEHYFPVNVYQGFIDSIGDYVYVHPENKAFLGISNLKQLTDSLIQASGFPSEK